MDGLTFLVEVSGESVQRVLFFRRASGKMKLAPKVKGGQLKLGSARSKAGPVLAQTWSVRHCGVRSPELPCGSEAQPVIRWNIIETPTEGANH